MTFYQILKKKESSTLCSLFNCICYRLPCFGTRFVNSVFSLFLSATPFRLIHCSAFERYFAISLELSLLLLFFADAPVCGSIHEELLGALKHETLTLKCEVDASPPADSFHWTFNSSGEPTDLPARLHSSEVCSVAFYLQF